MQSYSGNSVIIERERALSELRWYHEIFVLTSIEVGIFLFLLKERMIHMIQNVVTSIILYSGTAVDLLIILMLFFAKRKSRKDIIN